MTCDSRTNTTTVTTTPTQLPPGIYGIVLVSVQDGKLDSICLAASDNGKGHVTIRSVGVVGCDPQQEVTHHFHDGLDCLSLTSPL